MIARSVFGAVLVAAVIFVAALPSGCASSPSGSDSTGGVAPVTGGANSGGTSSVGQGGVTSVVTGGSGFTGGSSAISTGGSVTTSTGGMANTASGGANGGAPAATTGGANTGGMVPVGGGGACPSGATACGSACRTLTNDVANCGACDKVCATGQACQNGVCACAMGSTSCGGTCMDTTNDAKNCGACGTVCPTGQVCSQGKCGAACAARLTLCGSTCVDLQGSATHCGACGTACPTGQTCSAGMCRCAVGSTVCNGACQDIASNVNSCGSCTNVCAKGASCVAGVCQCPAPQAACGGTCLDVTKDPANCGTCGTQCTGTQQCLYGGCLDPSSVNCGSTTQVGRTCAAATSIDVSKYFINNNLWGQQNGTGSQCIWRTCQNGDLVGWGTSWDWANNPSAVKSYASLVVGWHWGVKHPDTGLPVQLSANRSVTCGWDFKVTQTGTMNVAYDLFAHTISNPASTNDPTDEIMIWLYTAGGAGPIGGVAATPTVGGATWNLHRGATDRWNVFSYVRTTNATTSVLNLMDFMNDLVARGWIQSSKYLTSVQAGTEVFVGNGQVDTNGFYCRVQ